ncbi:MAG TPA: STAS domain-containing protein [Vicinamibacterales bacterium]|nr:STAS domain-containing protein [Vicinamibacterales bacterium]
MQMNERTTNDVFVLDLKGKLTTMDGGAQRMRDRVTTVLFEGQPRVLLNLGEVPHIDSCALGQLALCKTAAIKNRGTVKLFGVTGRVVQLLTITKLIQEFEMYDTEQEALDSFLVTA